MKRTFIKKFALFIALTFVTSACFGMDIKVKDDTKEGITNSLNPGAKFWGLVLGILPFSISYTADTILRSYGHKKLNPLIYLAGGILFSVKFGLGAFERLVKANQDEKLHVNKGYEGTLLASSALGGVLSVPFALKLFTENFNLNFAAENKLPL